MKFFVSALISLSILLFANNAFAQQPRMVEPGSEEEEQMEEPEEEQPRMQEPEELEEPEEQEEMFMEEESQVPERLRYYKEKYEATYDAPFEVVWNAVKEALREINCMIMTDKYSQTEEGFFKGVIKSDMCVFVEGEGKTIDTLQRYSLKVPVIRGGVWINGRMQYKFIIKEQEDGQVHLRLIGEVSGFENYVTSSVHFWESNGILETRMLRRIEENIESGG